VKEAMVKAYDTGREIRHTKETARRKIIEHLKKRQARIMNKQVCATEPFGQGIYLFCFGYEDPDNQFKPEVCNAFFSKLRELVEAWLESEYPKEGMTEKEIREKLTDLMIEAYEGIGRKVGKWFLSPYEGFFRPFSEADSFFRLVGENHD